MSEIVNVGIVGSQFMGNAHSNAYLKVSNFFELPVKPVLKVACARNPENLNAFANRFNWEHQETSWETLVQRDDVDLIDISTPNNTHAPIAIEAARNGKHILCEKPIAMNLQEARRMLDAARDAGVVHMMVFNYRFLPAVAFMKQMIESGKLGQIYHFNAVYYQDWLVDPGFPMAWRHEAATAGSGAHGDLNAHIIDLARFLIGEIGAVSGTKEVFIKERPYSDRPGMGQVTVDDATSFMARFRNGTLGSFQVTRMGTGRKNYLKLEIFGSEGGLSFNLEDLNVVEYYTRQDDPLEQGYRKILITESGHPYIRSWWPPGHIIGWEHTFVHEVANLLSAVHDKKGSTPDFYDGMKCQEVLDAVVSSCDSGAWVDLSADL